MKAKILIVTFLLFPGYLKASSTLESSPSEMVILEFSNIVWSEPLAGYVGVSIEFRLDGLVTYIPALNFANPPIEGREKSYFQLNEKDRRILFSNLISISKDELEYVINEQAVPSAAWESTSSCKNAEYEAIEIILPNRKFYIEDCETTDQRVEDPSESYGYRDVVKVYRMISEDVTLLKELINTVNSTMFRERVLREREDADIAKITSKMEQRLIQKADSSLLEEAGLKFNASKQSLEVKD